MEENNTTNGNRMYSVIINNIVAYTLPTKIEAIFKGAEEKKKRPGALVRLAKA